MHSLLVSSVSEVCMHQDPMGSQTEVYSSIYGERRFVWELVVKVVPPFTALLLLFTQCNGCLSSLLPGGSWLGCQDLPAPGAVSIQELVANNGSSWMSQAHNFHFVMQLLIYNRVIMWILTVLLYHGLYIKQLI